MIRLPRSNGDAVAELLPRDPRYMNISSYEEVHSDLEASDRAPATPAAYIPEELPPDSPVTDVIVGDDIFSRCSGEDEYRKTRGIKQSLSASVLDGPTRVERPSDRADGVLAPSTNYTAFLEVYVIGADGQVLKKQSEYFPLVQTGSLVAAVQDEEHEAPKSLSPFAPILYSMTESPKAVLFGVTSGLLIFCLLLFTLCLLKRKASDGSANSDSNSDQGTLASTQTLQRSASLDECLGRSESPKDDSHTTAVICSACHQDQWIAQPILTHGLAHVFLEPSDHPGDQLLLPPEFAVLPQTFADGTTIANDHETTLRYSCIQSFEDTRLPSHADPETEIVNSTADFVC